MIIETLIANPAAGKTDAILNYLIESGEKAVIASPSRILSEQSYQKFIRMGGKAVIIDSSRKLTMKTVSATVNRAVKDEIPVLFITHSALSLIDTQGVTEYSLYVDEVPNLVEFREYSLKSNINLILDLCEPIQDGKGMHHLVLRPSVRPFVEEKARCGYDGSDTVDKALYGLYRALLNEKLTVMAKHRNGKIENGTEIFYLDDTKMNGWSLFKKITIACSNLMDTYTGKVLLYYRDCQFVESPLMERLKFREYSNTQRVKIHVMTDLEKWSKYKSDNNNAFDRMVEYILGKCGNDFIYTVNKARESMTDGIGERVQYGAQGLNCYTHYTNVAVLFSFNPQRWERELLQDMALQLELPRNEFVNARHVSDYLDPAFQLCLRCDLRNNGSEKDINLFVPDMVLAEYIKRYLPGASIITDCRIDTTLPSMVKETYPTKFGMTKDEMKRFNAWTYRERKKGNVFTLGDPKSDFKVMEWIKKQRRFSTT